jgi:hypothetical protein
MTLRRACALSLWLGAGTACGAHGPATPKAPVSATPTIAPRFDGVYAAKATGADGTDYGFDYLRFVADGRVLSLSSPAPMENAVPLLYTHSKRPATGTFETHDGMLKFVMKSDLGAVEYEGVASADNQLQVRWHSQVNGATADETFTFVPVEQQDDKDASAPAPSAAPPMPDVSLLPSGSGWFCFRAKEAGVSRCERTASACETTRKGASNEKVTRCARQGSAYCSTLTEKASGKGTALCYPSDEDCRAANAGMQNAQNAPDFTISACDQE